MNVFDLVASFAVRGVDEAEADIKSATRTAERGFNDMSNSAKKAADDVEEIGKESTEAGEDVEEFGEKAKESGEKTEEGFKKADMAFMSFAGNLASDLVSGALDFLTGGVTALVEAAEESQEDFGKLSVAFDKAGYSAEVASDVYYDFVGLLGETDQAVEASNHLAKLCKSEEELAQWGNIAAGVFAEFGDSLPLESLTEAANETAKVGTVTGALADALNWAGISEDEFNAKLAACSTEAERSALITQTLSEIYGDAGQAYRETNEALVANRESQARANEAAASAGNALLPLATMVQDVGTALLERATPGLQRFSDFMTGTAMPAVQGFGDFMNGTVLPAFEKWSPLIVGVATMLGVLTVAVNLNNISNAVLAAQWTLTSGAMTAAATAQGILNTVMAANPIGIVIALLAGLVAAFVYLWNTSEEFRNFWIDLMVGIKDALAGFSDAIVRFFTEDLPATFKKAGQFFQELGGLIGGVFGSIRDAMGGAADWASEKWESVTSFLSGIPDRITGFFSGLGQRITDAIGDIDFPTPHLEGGTTISIAGKSFTLPTVKWYETGGYFEDPQIVGIGDSEGGEYALPANMRSSFTRDFARAIAADMPVGNGGESTTNEYNITITFDISKLRDLLENFDSVEELVKWIKRTRLMYPTRAY